MAEPNTRTTRMLIALLVAGLVLYGLVWLFGVARHNPTPPTVNPSADIGAPKATNLPATPPPAATAQPEPAQPQQAQPQPAPAQPQPAQPQTAPAQPQPAQ